MLKKIMVYLGKLSVRAYTKLFLKRSVVFHNPLIRGPKIIVANHPSGTDPFILFSLLRERVSILIVDVAFKVPVFGKFIKYLGHIPVNHKKGHIAFRRAMKVLRNGGSIIIFIEGDFSPFVDRFLRPHTGAVRLALATGVPLVPVGIGVKEDCVRNINAVVSGSTKWGKWYLNGPYAITIGNPINFSGNVEDRNLVRNLTDKIMEKIMALTQESAGRIKATN